MKRYYNVSRGTSSTCDFVLEYGIEIEVEAETTLMTVFDLLYPKIYSYVKTIADEIIGEDNCHYVRGVGLEQTLLMIDFGSHHTFIYLKEVDEHGEELNSPREDPTDKTV